ncbi:MAG: nucleotide pyrophosphohydrolase [Proteobacteria bacterium]|nr:nucleotide pyrophosphohydrolase [Pseudomonadota bacterium]
MGIDQLSADIQEFSRERDWGQFHTPKNLAASVNVEAAELLEIFMWLTPEQSQQLDPAKLEAARDEIGDVLICLLNLSHRLGIDPLEAAQQKILKNKAKYPVEKSRGIAKKYNEI